MAAALSVDLLKKISKGGATTSNMTSIVESLEKYGRRFGLDEPHRLAHYLSQLAHESGGFHYDKEIASGAAYEGRRDLGNTQRGDGKKFKGRTGGQITGRANYRAFTKWVKKFIPDAPDFEKEPERINEDPYEGLGPIWYWDEGNPDPKNRSLNVYADKNNIEQITKLINGGLNGYADRIDYYDRTALALLGFPINASGVKAFQREAQKRGHIPKDRVGQPTQIDGDVGPTTRSALHVALMEETSGAMERKDTAIAPITEETEVEVEVVPPKIEKEVAQKSNWLASILAMLGGGSGLVAWAADLTPLQIGLVVLGFAMVVVITLAFGVWIARRLKAIRQEIEG